MAVNWTTAQAVKVIREGKDLEAIQDIGRRFPLFAVAAARGVEGLVDIISTLPDRVTARTVEAVFKEGLAETAADEEIEEEVEDKPKSKAKAKAEKAPAKSKSKVVEPDEDDEDEEEEEVPKKRSGKSTSAPKGKGKGKSKPAPEPEEDDEDEDEDEDGYEEMSLVQLKKEAKKNKVDIKGLKTPEQIIAALRGEEPEDEDEDEDEDDWDI